MRKHYLSFLIISAVLFSIQIIQAQVEDYKGNSINRYENHHSGNKINTIFYNYGLVGNVNEISCEWPIGTGNEYVGDVTPLVGIEFVHPNGDTLHSIITCSSPRQSPEYFQGVFSGFEPLPGFAALPIPGETGKVAMSQLPDTWPDFWPDKKYTDVMDQGWREDVNDPGWAGSWNGYFGKDIMSADQESYFQMDDDQDMEWRIRYIMEPDTSTPDPTDSLEVPIIFYPDELDTSRAGLGIRVTVRGMQWSHFLAEDCIFWLLEITNVGTTHYDKVSFGMVVGTLAGGRNDSEDDLAFFDPENDITYSWDGTPGPIPGWTWVSDEIQVGYAGYAFLESPGNPFDGIDNDGDSDNSASPTLDVPDLLTMTGTMSYAIGQELVLIDYDTYERQVVTMPDSGSIRWYLRDEPMILYAGQNVIENSNNGIDDNFNGLIDERLGEEVNGKRLDHVGKKYKDYFTGAGVDDLMIDEARDDGIDNDGDWDSLTDDVGFDGTPSTGDTGEGDGLPSYGEPNFDRTDVDESDQIGLTSFEYFSPPGAVRMNDDDGLWARMTPGLIDVVSDEPEDGDFIYGSGYFPLPPGKTERFSMALLFGEDLLDITQNKLTVQQIYNNNYNFARPPDKPTVTAVPGDGQVTLYWDDLAEFSFDPANEGNEYDFEGYKVYRATDPGFLENFNITNALGNLTFHEPIAQFDLKNGKSGFFPLTYLGTAFYLGEDNGITHVWTDTTVENGQQYFYAVTSYDNGNEFLGFFPAETSKYIFVDEGGNVTTDVNTVVVVPTAPAAGYTDPELSAADHVEGSASGLIYIDLVDPREIADDKVYEISFDQDTLYQAQVYNIRDVSDDNNPIDLYLDEELSATQDDDLILGLFDAYFDSLYGLYPGSFNTVQWFTTLQSEVFDGQRIYLIKPRFPGQPILENSGWSSFGATDPDSLYEYNFGLINYSSVYLSGQAWSADYRIIFADQVVDTAQYYNWYNLISFPEQPVYFRVWNESQQYFPMMVFDEVDTLTDGRLQQGEAILIFETLSGDTIPTYAVSISSDLQNGQIFTPEEGDTLIINMYKAFSSADRYTYSTLSASIDDGSIDLDKIRVYPNPYLGASTQEPASPYSSGRGERRITFIHLPDECTIRIYNIRGELVDTVRHFDAIEDGSENWDLRTKDGLDIAYGVYIYHVDSPYGEHIGKFAVVK